MTMEESDPTITAVMPAVCRHPRCHPFTAMRKRDPCVYIMASGFNGTLYVGVTFNLAGMTVEKTSQSHRYPALCQGSPRRKFRPFGSLQLACLTVDAGTSPA